MEEAGSTGPTLLQRITRLHHNWKYPFLRPTNEAVVKRYKQKFHTTAGDAPPAAAPDAAAGAAAAEPAEAAAGAP